jgi:hypothetical protein
VNGGSVADEGWGVRDLWWAGAGGSGWTVVGWRRGDGICALGGSQRRGRRSLLVGDPLMAAQMAWGGGWGGGVRRGDGICTLGRIVEERGQNQLDGWDGGGVDPAIGRSRWRRGHGYA